MYPLNLLYLNMPKDNIVAFWKNPILIWTQHVLSWLDYKRNVQGSGNVIA